MNKKIFLIMLCMILLVGTITAFENLNTLKPAKLNTDYVILQTCNDATYINLTISNSNGLIITNAEMTNNGTVWTYNYTPITLGRTDVAYLSDGCEKSGTAYFEVTYNGNELKQPQSTMYISLFLFLIFIFIITILGIKQLPSSNEKDEEGKILSVSYLKYLRPIGWFFLWMLFIAMLFLSSNIAFAFLGEQLFANILFVLFRICFGLTPLIVVVWIIWIYRQMFHDKQMQKMLNRGIFPQGKL